MERSAGMERGAEPLSDPLAGPHAGPGAGVRNDRALVHGRSPLRPKRAVDSAAQGFAASSHGRANSDQDGNQENYVYTKCLTPPTVTIHERSEERRVGQECRSRGAP